MTPIDDAKKFQDASAGDESIGAAIKELQGASGSTEDYWSKLIALAAQHGYHFTREEAQSASEDIELTEEDLEKVAGGDDVEIGCYIPKRREAGGGDDINRGRR